MKHVFALAISVTLLAACPPPPPVEEADAGLPDAGTVIAAGEECFSPTTSNECGTGLECAAVVDVAAGTFACVAPALAGAACFFNNDEVEAPPEDGCASGLACGGQDICVRAGAIDAPCESPTECDTLNCGLLVDGSGDVCVVNECAGGCEAGTVCQQAGRCGLTCVAPAGQGVPCVVSGDDACSPRRLGCAAGLECFRGDAANATCDAPGGGGSRCNNNGTPDDGCQAEFQCDGDGVCVRRD
jgi:hypothetical protein